ncbi:hypothetical protein HFV01_17395 [Limnospira fusiformis SAG 85.79]|uniref:Uncharacterized protein n=2 Tax=Limnospira TaxID=2596745 RepID=A0A9P1KDA5_9CYAN|nr:hypothetical protein AmaxDRAFT_3397 [Limnospira maxima CS-328]QJB27229.1 hypothetical protein HFV01_17395 [Limnospira fusiformis SAG 85.79]RAQ43392.1 hypothetical protein B9S53_10850 [Arthrospira sp. O9.13F]UWU49519.1 hypothetical protein APLC1_4376 [Arthrospira platensis C1]CDM94394.1 hypothetical protein ARTHRO_12068 [Limnospira indica PCC 8005]
MPEITTWWGLKPLVAGYKRLISDHPYNCLYVPTFGIQPSKQGREPKVINEVSSGSREPIEHRVKGNGDRHQPKF